MIVNSKEMLEQARLGKYAIPHFNINNLEWTKYILEQCELDHSPVILGVSEGAAKYMGGLEAVSFMVYGLVKSLKITVPVVLHIDHGTYEGCLTAIACGFSSIMFDGSKLPLKENLAKTTTLVNLAHAKGITIEAEIGSIRADGLADSSAYATIDDAMALSYTGIDSLAPALGSVHGLYKGKPKLDFGRMHEIATKTKLPLVLHGGTGIPDAMIKKSLQNGICKLNINTELQVAWSKAIRIFLNKNPNVYDPRLIIGAGEVALKKCVHNKIILLGSGDKK